MANRNHTAKQNEFIKELQKGKSGKDAAIAAGYSEKTARITASKLKNKPHVAASLDKVKRKVEKNIELTREKALKKFIEISDAAALHEQFGPATKAHEIFCNAMGYLTPENNKEKNAYEVTITIPPEENS